MRAVVLERGELSLADIPEPLPGRRHLLARPLACGICGSDLHAVDAPAAMADLQAEVDASAPHSPLRGPRTGPADSVVLGHEFCAEVVEVGGDVSGFMPGDVVVSVPRLFDDAGRRHTLGYSSSVPGGLAELMLIDADVALHVPPGVEPWAAALTEPLAVAARAVNRSAITPGQSAVVFGCGPIGLGVVAQLRARGAGLIVAIDPSPARRALAEVLGADLAVEPDGFEPGALPAVPPPVMFDAVGAPGMLDRIVLMAPARTHVVVVGACFQADTWRPMLALGRELTLSFVMAYSDDEFASTLEWIGGGAFDASVFVSARLPLSEAIDGFDRLRHPVGDAKVLVVAS